MKAPFSNSFYDNHHDDDYMDDYDYERIQEKKEIAALVFDDMLSKERGNVVAPDTTGVDFSF